MPIYKIELKAHHKTFICQCWAEFKKRKETIALFGEKYRDDIQAAGVTDFERFEVWLDQRINYYWNHPDAAKWQEQAREIREHWLAGVGDIPLANKRYRLEEIQRVYESPDEHTYRRIRALEQARKEVEGDTTTIRVEPISPDAISSLSREQRQELRELILANPTVPPLELLKRLENGD